VSFFLGVDGGGTRTRVALVDEAGHECARAEGPATLIDPANPNATIGVITDLCREVVSIGGADLPVEGLWAGIAGAGTEPTRGVVETALREAGLSSSTSVGADAEATFHDAFPSGPGILLLSGTGSIALARGADGSRLRVGGWGVHLGDEGSGYRIGMWALRALVRGEDGRGVATDLRDPVLKVLGLAGPADLIKWITSARKADVASLVPLICQVAEAGDQAATNVIEKAVDELVGHVRTLMRRLEPWPATPEVALAGGLLKEDRPLRLRVIRALEELPCLPRDHAPDGARGACSLAMGLVDHTDESQVP
jgi:N-acetylglucosamine kinase-like BadF-type ATPase